MFRADRLPRTFFLPSHLTALWVRHTMPPPDYPRLPTGYRFGLERLRTVQLSLTNAAPPDTCATRDIDVAVRAAAALVLAAHAGEDRFLLGVQGGVVEGELDLAAPLDRLVGQVREVKQGNSEDGPRFTVYGRNGAGEPAPTPSTPLHLDYALVADGKRVSLALTYDTATLPQQEAQWLIEHIETGLDAILQATPDLALASIDLAPPYEASTLARYSSCSSTIHEPDAYPTTVKTLSAFFLHAAERYPDDPALHFVPSPSEPDSAGAVRLSYAQLSHLAHYLAAQLLLSLPHSARAPGAPRNGALVLPIVIDKSPSMVVSLLAASLAGFGYLALEPSFPSVRKEGICGELAEKGMLASVALVQGTDGEQARWAAWQRDGTQSELFTRVVDPAQVLGPLLDFAATRTSAAELAEQFPVPSIGDAGGWPQVRADDLAYVIYTSGTTGKPKGIMVEQRNVAAFLR